MQEEACSPGRREWEDWKSTVSRTAEASGRVKVLLSTDPVPLTLKINKYEGCTRTHRPNFLVSRSMDFTE